MFRLSSSLLLLIMFGVTALSQEQNHSNGVENTETSGVMLDPALGPQPVVNDELRHTEATEEWERGRQLFRNGDYENSIERLKKAVRLDPTLTSAQADLGVLYLQLRNYEAAIETLNQATINGQASAATWQYLGYAYDQVNDRKQAIDCYQKAVAADPMLGVVFNNLGFDYIDMKEFPNAENAFLNALRINKTMPQSTGGLCVTYWMQGRANETIEYCNRAQDLAGPTAFMSYLLGWGYYTAGRYQEALDSLTQSIKQNPTAPQVFVALGHVHNKLGQPEKAMNNYRRALDLNPNNAMAYAGIGVTLYHQGKYRDAKQALYQALHLDPELVEAHYNLAIACLTLQLRDCALEQYGILKMMEPSLSNTLYNAIYGDKLLSLKSVATR